MSIIARMKSFREMKITGPEGNQVEFEDLPEDIRAFLDAVGPPDKVHERLRMRQETSMRLDAMSESLTKEHPDQWAALHGEDLVFAESHSELLLKCDESGFDMDLTATRLLRTQKVVWVL